MSELKIIRTNSDEIEKIIHNQLVEYKKLKIDIDYIYVVKVRYHFFIKNTQMNRYKRIKKGDVMTLNKKIIQNLKMY